MASKTIAQFLRKLDRMKEGVIREAEYALVDRVVKTHRKAVRNAPLDTGKLRQSIQLRVSSDRRSGFVTAGNISDNSRNYAAFIEFGTGTKVSIPKGFEAMAIRFKGTKRIIGMRAQPYLIPSYLQEREYLLNDIKRIIKNEVGRA